MTAQAIFDTDAGSDIDDLYALALALRHPNLNLLGVTTVAGDTQARARLVAKMLRLARREDVPVFAGIQIPEAIVRRGMDAREYRQNLTHTDFVGSGAPEHSRSFDDAIGFILDTLSRAQTPITLIATGPWTNIAEVLRRADHQQRSNIGCLALMGGEIRLMHSESNVKNDPEAAAQVLDSKVPIFMGTWSVTRKLSFTMSEVAGLMRDSQSPFALALHQCTDLWWGNGMRHKTGPVCYDVIPVFWAAGDRQDISCIKCKTVAVELEGVHTRGMTVFSPWQLMGAERTDATSSEYLAVTDALDAEALKRRYVEMVFDKRPPGAGA